MQKKELAWGHKMSIFCCDRRIMALFQIPKQDLPAFLAITGFDDGSFSGMSKAFAESQPSLHRKKYISQLAAKVPKSTQKDILVICTALFSLYALMAENGISASNLSSEIAQAVKETPEGSRLSGDKIEILKRRLASLLSFEDSFNIMVKAVNVRNEYERTFCNSRILSDIRPVFTKTTDSFSAAIVVHNLQIGFHEGATGEHNEIYVSLDDDHLLELKETIERAQKKSAALKAILKTSKVTCVDV
jgi:hypothetical protein